MRTQRQTEHLKLGFLAELARDSQLPTDADFHRSGQERTKTTGGPSDLRTSSRERIQ